MTDNEETRSYNDILADNKELRKAINVEFSRFLLERARHYYWAGLDASSLEQLLQRAIKAWKAQQQQ